MGGALEIAPGGRPRGGGVAPSFVGSIALIESTPGLSTASKVRGGGAVGGGLKATGGAPGGGPGALPLVSVSPSPPVILTPLALGGTVGGGPGGFLGGALIEKSETGLK